MSLYTQEFVKFRENLKNNTLDCIYKLETDSQAQEKKNYGYQMGQGEGQIKSMRLTDTNNYA